MTDMSLLIVIAADVTFTTYSMHIFFAANAITNQ